MGNILITELPDNALNEAIRQLSISGAWPIRLRMLIAERNRRNAIQ